MKVTPTFWKNESNERREKIANNRGVYIAKYTERVYPSIHPSPSVDPPPPHCTFVGLDGRKRAGNFNLAKVTESTARKERSLATRASSFKSAGRNWKRAERISARVVFTHRHRRRHHHHPRINPEDSGTDRSGRRRSNSTTRRRLTRPPHLILMQPPPSERAIAILIYRQAWRQSRGLKDEPNRLRRLRRTRVR